MAVGIRRLSDQRNDVISLGRLIRDVGQHSEVLSRDHYRRLYHETYRDDAYMLRRAGEEYDELAGAGEDQLTPSATSDDLLQLSTAAQSVRHHVNKHVAHTDDKGLAPTATYQDLDDALEAEWQLYRRYSLLITGSAPSNRVPTMQEDWTRPFLVAWKPDEQLLGLVRKRGIAPRSDG